MLKCWIIDCQFAITIGAKVVKQRLDHIPIDHGGMGCILAQDWINISDIWSSAKGSIENWYNRLPLQSSVKRYQISRDGMGCVAHWLWQGVLVALGHINEVKYGAVTSDLFNSNWVWTGITKEWHVDTIQVVRYWDIAYCLESNIPLKSMDVMSISIH